MPWWDDDAAAAAAAGADVAVAGDATAPCCGGAKSAANCEARSGPAAAAASSGSSWIVIPLAASAASSSVSLGINTAVGGELELGASWPPCTTATKCSNKTRSRCRQRRERASGRARAVERAGRAWRQGESVGVGVVPRPTIGREAQARIGACVALASPRIRTVRKSHESDIAQRPWWRQAGRQASKQTTTAARAGASRLLLLRYQRESERHQPTSPLHSRATGKSPLPPSFVPALARYNALSPSRTCSCDARHEPSTGT